MYDASSKFPTGILAGRSFDFGNFDECLKTVTTGLELSPQYCIISIRFLPTAKLYPNYNNITPSNLNPTDSVWEGLSTKVSYPCIDSLDSNFNILFNQQYSRKLK